MFLEKFGFQIMAESKCNVDPKFMNELPSRKPSFSFSRNENKSASCPGCTIRDREIEDLKRRLQIGKNFFATDCSFLRIH